MRLEGGDQAARLERARGLERGADLRGVVGVVVVDERAPRRAAVLLEAAGGAGEPRQAGRGLRRRQPGRAEGIEGSESIEDVVLARHLKLDLDPVHEEA